MTAERFAMTASQKSASSFKPNLDVDVLVIGGGLAGGTLSLALAQNGFQVATVDTEDTIASGSWKVSAFGMF